MKKKMSWVVSTVLMFSAVGVVAGSTVLRLLSHGW